MLKYVFPFRLTNPTPSMWIKMNTVSRMEHFKVHCKQYNTFCISIEKKHVLRQEKCGRNTCDILSLLPSSFCFSSLGSWVNWGEGTRTGPQHSLSQEACTVPLCPGWAGRGFHSEENIIGCKSKLCSNSASSVKAVIWILGYLISSDTLHNKVWTSRGKWLFFMWPPESQ